MRKKNALESENRFDYDIEDYQSLYGINEEEAIVLRNKYHRWDDEKSKTKAIISRRRLILTR